jgi:hypothetical protein
MSYEQKYLKYKQKYIELRNSLDGGISRKILDKRIKLREAFDGLSENDRKIAFEYIYHVHKYGNIDGHGTLTRMYRRATKADSGIGLIIKKTSEKISNWYKAKRISHCLSLLHSRGYAIQIDPDRIELGDKIVLPEDGSTDSNKKKEVTSLTLSNDKKTLTNSLKGIFKKIKSTPVNVFKTFDRIRLQGCIDVLNNSGQHYVLVKVNGVDSTDLESGISKLRVENDYNYSSE